MNVEKTQIPTPWSLIIWSVVAVLVGLNLPLFLCQHLTNDAVMFDLQAKCALEGGVLYRDILEPNLPGVVWIHMAVRSIAGWSTYAIRVFDLLVLMGVLWAITGWVAKKGESYFSLRRGATSLAVLSFYFSLSEWSHVQRDMWALLPCLFAMQLRFQTTEQMSRESQRATLLRSFGEGVLWAIAFWIKPHIAVPAIFVMIATLCITKFSRRVIWSWLAVLTGGVVIGGVGSAWLIRTGAWDAMWEMLLVWNPEYLERARERATSGMLLTRLQQLAPWSWAHLLAVGTVIFYVKQHWTETDHTQHTVLHTVLRKPLVLSALYLGWMVQVLALQFPFPYVHIPGVVLAIGLVGTWQLPEGARTIGWLGFAAACALAMQVSPATRPSRLQHWWACVSEGSTPEVRAAIQLEGTFRWDELQPVIEFLREQNVKDGEVTAYSGATCHIYPRLNVRPSTRFVFFDVIARLFLSRTDEIHQALEESNQRYVVSSLYEAGLPRECIDGPQDPQTMLPTCFPIEELQEFPYTQAVIFRSGQYLIHKVEKPLGPLCTEYLPLAKDADE